MLDLSDRLRRCYRLEPLLILKTSVSAHNWIEREGDELMDGSLLWQPDIFAKQLHTRVTLHECELGTIQRKSDPHRSNANHAL